MERLAEASVQNTDFVLSTELGTTNKTKRAHGLQYDSDWSSPLYAGPGEPIGLFTQHSWAGTWTHVPHDMEPRNLCVYILTATFHRILVGVFYAPLAGRDKQQRMRFFRDLRQAWKTVAARFPDSWHILGGDADRPGLFKGAARHRII